MRIAAKPLKQYPWYLRLFFWNQRRKYGDVLIPAMLWARAPRLFLSIAALHRTLDRRSSPLEAALRSLVTVRISQLNHCSFCVDLNSALLARRSASLEKLGALHEWRTSPLFSAREQAALEYAEAMTCNGPSVQDEMFVRLREFLTDDGIIELTALIAFQNLSSKFNSALDVPSQGFCTTPQQALRSPHPAPSRPGDEGPLRDRQGKV